MQGNKASDAGAYAESIPYCESLMKLKPDHALAFNNLGAALYRLGGTKKPKRTSMRQSA
jgi:tetratricopeptide (TPR) repeat protein